MRLPDASVPKIFFSLAGVVIQVFGGKYVLRYSGMLLLPSFLVLFSCFALFEGRFCYAVGAGMTV